MPRNVYDAIAPYYDLLFDDWNKAAESEGRRLDALLRTRGVNSVLDVTCGTGLQCVGLAAKGYAVTGMDSSKGMLRRARLNARRAGASVRWVQGDLRDMGASTSGPFDCAISCGNSLAHLATEEDLSGALYAIGSVLRPGGVCLIDAWNYETMLRDKPASAYSKTGELNGRRVVLYDERTYRQNVVHVTFRLLVETRQRWVSRGFSMDLRAWSKNELVRALQSAGFDGIIDYSHHGSVELLGTKR